MRFLHKKYIYTRRKKAGHLNIETKMATEYSLRVFASQPIRTRVSKLFLCKVACLSYGEYIYINFILRYIKPTW